VWAEGAKNMVWRHIVRGDPPALELVRVEDCGGFAIVFFEGPRDAEGEPLNQPLLWAAGSTSESPEGADGGWADSFEDAVLSQYRDAHGPCEIAPAR
jgi:hypothetical protein